MAPVNSKARAIGFKNPCSWLASPKRFDDGKLIHPWPDRLHQRRLGYSQGSFVPAITRSLLEPLSTSIVPLSLLLSSSSSSSSSSTASNACFTFVLSNRNASRRLCFNHIRLLVRKLFPNPACQSSVDVSAVIFLYGMDCDALIDLCLHHS